MSRTIVSTNDSKIAEVAHQFGTELPFMRPVAIAQDDTLDYPLIHHALECPQINEEFRLYLVLVQTNSTTLICPDELIDRAIQTIKKHELSDCVRHFRFLL